MIIVGGEVSKIDTRNSSVITVERPITLEPENTHAVDSSFFDRYPLTRSVISSHQTVVQDVKTGNYYIVSNDVAEKLGIKVGAVISVI